jgi:glc operon protein GlcG
MLNEQGRKAMKSSFIYSTAMAAALAVCLSPAAKALDKSPELSLDVAKKMAAACEAKAKQQNWKMNISVVDDGANEIFFEKMDGAYLGSRDIALHKAQTSARFPFPTRFVQELAYGNTRCHRRARQGQRGAPVFAQRQQRSLSGCA